MIARHPFLGLLSGFLLGVGLALILVQLAIVPFGSWTVVAMVVIFTLLGLVFALAIPMRGAPPPAAYQQAPPPQPTSQQPPASAAPPSEPAATPPPSPEKPPSATEEAPTPPAGDEPPRQPY